MHKIKVLTIGKTKEAWLKDALTEYEKRLTPYLTLEWALFSKMRDLESAAAKEKVLIALDLKGKLLSSEDLSQHLYQTWGAHISFVIGESEGLSSTILEKAHFLWSFSPLTFTHQMCRLILVEQLYRAVEIAKGGKYHK